MKEINFKNINWGPDEAKGDKNLPNYFFEFPDFNEIKEGNCRYIIGRKGTGKTAVIEAVKNKVDAEALFFSTAMSLRDFPLAIVRKLRDKTYNDKSQFVPVWNFLIIIETCKLIVQDAGAEPIEEVDSLKRMLVDNFGSIDFTIAETLTFLDKKQSKLKFFNSFIGGEYTEENGKNVSGEIHYQKARKHILDKLKNIRSESRYYLFIDELDEGYKAGDDNLRLLILSLLRSAEDSFIELNGIGINVIPILALRNDIFDRLEDNDINKLDDYIIRLNWLSIRNGRMSLFDVVNKRIQASFEETLTWDNVAVDSDPNLPHGVDSLWKYITNRTFERPRDLVKFLKICSKETTTGPLTFKDVSAAEDKYSSWFYQEFQNEVHSYLPVWRESLQALTKLGKWHFTYAELTSKLISNEDISLFLTEKHWSPDKIIELLFDFSVIGNIDRKRRWLFKYKDHDLAWDKDMDMIIHFGFAKKLRLKHVNNKGNYNKDES